MKKTAWIICQYAGSPRHGMNYRPYYVGRGLARNGYHVCVVSGSYSHQYVHRPATTGRFTLENIDGLTYCWVKTPHYPRAGSIWRVYSWFMFSWRLLLLRCARLPHPSVIIVSSPMPFPILNGFLLSRRHKARLVFEVRDLWPMSLVQIGGVPRLHPLVLFLKAVESFAYRAADMVVSVLPRAFLYMRARGLPAERFAWIPNGIETDRNAASPTPSEPAKEAVEQFIIGYAGSVNRTNAMESFIEAAILLKDDARVRFVVQGNGDELEALQLRASAGGARVDFRMPVAKLRVQEVLAGWDACYIGWRDLTLYRYGTSANKVFDYMLAGKPILQSIRREDDTLEAIGCGVNALPESPASIADGVRRMLAMSREMLQSMGEAGRRYVLEHHDYTVLGSRYAGLLDRLIVAGGR